MHWLYFGIGIAILKFVRKKNQKIRREIVKKNYKYIVANNMNQKCNTNYLPPNICGRYVDNLQRIYICGKYIEYLPRVICDISVDYLQQSTLLATTSVVINHCGSHGK